MSLNDPIANALNNINNAEMASKQNCLLNHSKFLEAILVLLKEKGYVKQYKILEKKPVNQILVSLDGKINKCKAVKPRHPVKRPDYEKFEKSYLISRDVGILIVSTTEGVMSHKDAKEKNLGGRIIGYVY